MVSLDFPPDLVDIHQESGDGTPLGVSVGVFPEKTDRWLRELRG